MPNITIEKAEGDYLRTRLRDKYENNTKQKLTVNSVRANYMLLAEEITTTVQGQSFGTYNFNRYFKATDAQLQSLFWDKSITFREDFVNACYAYWYGQPRNVFFKQSDVDSLIQSWRTEEAETLPNTEGVAAEQAVVGDLRILLADTESVKTAFEANNKHLKMALTISEQEKGHLKTEKEQLERLVESFKNLPKPTIQSNWLKILSLIGLAALIGLSIALYKTHRKLHLTTLWYKPPAIAEEVELKDELVFVNDPEFRARIRILVKSLRQGHESLLSNKIAPSNEKLKWYKDTVDTNDEAWHYVGVGNYDFYINRVNWTGFTKEEDPLTGIVPKTIKDTAHTLYATFASTLFSFPWKKKESDFLNQLLNIPPNKYLAVLLYVGFKTDTSVFTSRELMARYPAYGLDIKAAGKGYVMTSRPWWTDAMDTGRRAKFSWKDSVDNYPFYIGLSTPYPTIRKNSPNQRALWVEIPLKKPAAMIMGIDLIKNDE